MSVALLANIIVFLALIVLLAYASRNPTWSLAKKVLLGLVIGVLFGFALHLVYGGNNPLVKASVAWFNIVGNGYVQLLQMIVMPLVFVLILNLVAKLHNASSLGKISVLTPGTLLLTTLIAALIGVLVTLLFGLNASGLVQGAQETARLSAIENNYAGKVSDLQCAAIDSVFYPEKPVHGAYRR